MIQHELKFSEINKTWNLTYDNKGIFRAVLKSAVLIIDCILEHPRTWFPMVIDITRWVLTAVHDVRIIIHYQSEIFKSQQFPTAEQGKYSSLKV